MQTIIHFANVVFKPIIDLGAAPVMLIVLTLIAWASSEPSKVVFV